MISPALCPICDQPVISSEPQNDQNLPFCSKRCKEVDLLRWSNGSYAIVEPLSPEQMLEKLSPEQLEDMLEE